MRLNVSRASPSVIRKMWLRLNVRAAALSRKCCDMGSIHAGGPTRSSPWKSSVNPTIFHRTIAIAGVDPDLLRSRGRSVASTTTGSALESADQRAALSQLCARGSGPLLIITPHPDRRSAGALTL
jgi:hypothetical protein